MRPLSQSHPDHKLRNQRHYHGHTATALAAKPPNPLLRGHIVQNKEELLSLVDHQDTGTVEEHLEFFRDPFLRRYAQPDGPHLTVSDRKEDLEYPTYETALRGDKKLEELARKLMAAVTARLRHPGRTSLDSVYKIYSSLPEPRMMHISSGMRHRFLRALATPERRDTKSMLRYFAVVADVKNCGLVLRRTEWNHALAFASRYVGTTTGAETETALKLWREMEREAGIKGNDVTFNILFDVASKSGNFTLAEMIYREMELRGLKFNRYHHVSLIHFFGLKMDSDGVRAAYKEMVEAGEMIDTVVLNCVLSGLLKSGEDSSAEQVYERMKEKHINAPGAPERSYAMKRVVTQVLMMFSKVGKDYPTLRQNFQDSTLITPDLQTYRILVNHFAVKMGDLAKVAQFLDEMKWFQVQLHGSIFLALFKGFHLHGGFLGSDWSEKRLKGVFSALLHALDSGAKDLRIDTWLVMWALRAFSKCSSRDAVVEIYSLLKERWKFDAAKAQFLLDFLNSLLRPTEVVTPKKKFPADSGGLDGRGL
jgi:pentatricopeptide repeat protein